MPRGEAQQYSAKQARNAKTVNDKSTGLREPGERQVGQKTAVGGRKTPASRGPKAGARRGERRSSGAKPSGTNLDRGGGSAARSHKTSGSGARGKGARST